MREHPEYSSLTDLLDDIHRLQDNPPKGSRDSKVYKEWLRQVNDLMQLYNKTAKINAFVQRWTE
jgi:hypothetical protein